MKIKYTPTHHRRDHNASETTQAPFLATFNAIRNKLGRKRHRYSGPEILCALRPSKHINVDIWLKMKVEPRYIYRCCFNVGKTTLKQH